MQTLKSLLPAALKCGLKRWRRRAFEAVGSGRFSRPALYGLDRKLEQHLDFAGGFFVEAGANDGFTQSNTYHFECFRHWRGLLIEPVPMLAAECRRNRRVPVVEAALVARESPGATVALQFAGLMSTVRGALGDADTVARHVQKGLAAQNLPATYCLQVPARTLSSILDEIGFSGPIDLLSLDVEGAEPEALAGIDLARHAPRFICVEARRRGEIEACLGELYEVAEILTDKGEYQDILYRRL